MLKGLQAKLILIFMILTLATMAVIGAVLVNSVAVFYAEDFSSQMEGFFSDEMVGRMSAECRLEEQHDGGALYRQMLLYSSTLGIDTYRNFYILDSDGRFLTGSNPELGRALSVTENIVLAMNGGVGAKVDAYSDSMDFAVKVAANDGAYIVYIADTKEEVRDLTWIMTGIILKALAVALVISAVISFLLAKTITKPIKSITTGAKKIAGGDFSGKLAVNSDDEIGTLTETFNNMASELQKTLNDIESERSRLSTLFLYMTDGVAAFAKDGTLTHINKTAMQMLKAVYVENEVNFSEVFAPLISMEYDEVRALAKKGTYSVSIEISGKIYKSEFARYKDSNSATEGGVLVVMHDVTEQEEIDRSRREFIANVSHELRTPITNVKSYTETVLENDSLPDEDKKKFLGVVLSESDRMINIVKDLLLLSKFDSNKIELSLAPVDVSAVMQSVATAMDIEAKKSLINLVFTPEEGLPSVMGDRSRIEQVIVNVVSNAIKYTPENGTVTMACHADGNDVVIEVRDTGIGIPEKDLPHIFERFYRVDKARSRKMGGTGLGLSIAKEIVDMQGGNIYIDSVVGKGTVVTVVFHGNKAK